MDAGGDGDAGAQRSQRSAPSEHPAAYRSTESAEPVEGGHAPTLGEIGDPQDAPPQGRQLAAEVELEEVLVEAASDFLAESPDDFSVPPDFSVEVVDGASEVVVVLRLSLR